MCSVKEYHLYGILNKQTNKLRWQKADLWLPDTGVQVGDWVGRDTGERSGIMHLFYILIVVEVTLWLEFV